jgi:hypothetical protein
MKALPFLLKNYLIFVIILLGLGTFASYKSGAKAGKKKAGQKCQKKIEEYAKKYNG